jgi:hypothetical protein
MNKKLTINGCPTTFESIGGNIKATMVLKGHPAAAGFRDGLLAKGFERKQIKVMRRHDGQWTVLLVCKPQDVLKLAS